MRREVVVKRSVIRSILDYARACHPREGILLLKGSVSGGRITVDDVEIPPFAVHGLDFSSFPLHMLPIDFSVVGTAHSHPSGVLRPSTADLNKFYGRIMMIAAYPYRSEEDVAVFDGKGRLIEYKVVPDSDFERY